MNGDKYVECPCNVTGVACQTSGKVSEKGVGDSHLLNHRHKSYPAFVEREWSAPKKGKRKGIEHQRDEGLLTSAAPCL